MGIALTFLLTIPAFSFPAAEFQMEGIVTNINGNLVTIRDDKGKEVTIEVSVNDIKVGDPFLLKGQLFKSEQMRTELTLQEVEFLTNQCHINLSDVNTIPQLQQQTLTKVISWIEKKDCKLFDSFKASRAYYKQLKLRAPVPMPPIGWETGFLTNDEFDQYMNILAAAP